MSCLENVGEVTSVFPSLWKWTVKNLNQYSQNSSLKLSSPTFAIEESSSQGQRTNWRLACTVTSRSNHVLVVVKNLDQFDIIARVKWSGSSINHRDCCRPNNKLSFSKSDSKVYMMFVESSQCQHNLTLHCCIIVESVAPPPVICTPDDAGCWAVLGDFEKLLDNNKHSDVTLVLPRNKQIYAHKAILSSRSPVFEAMFEHNMKEKQLNTVEITDVEYKILKELLRFIYAGRVYGIDSISKELLAAADKYCVDELKALCEKNIFKQLNIDNALEICKLAVTYNAAVLKSNVYGYIVKHIKIICKKPEFKQLDPMTKDELFAILADKI